MIFVNKLLNIIVLYSKLHLQTYHSKLAGTSKTQKKKKILVHMTLWITLLVCPLYCQIGNLVRQVLLYIRTQTCEPIKLDATVPACNIHSVLPITFLIPWTWTILPTVSRTRAVWTRATAAAATAWPVRPAIWTQNSIRIIMLYTVSNGTF